MIRVLYLIVPFESTKAVKSYASIYKLLVKLRPTADFRMLHVLSNLTRLPGLGRIRCRSHCRTNHGQR